MLKRASYKDWAIFVFAAIFAFLIGFLSEASTEIFPKNLTCQVCQADFDVTPKNTSSGHICTPQDDDFETMRYGGRMAYCKRKVSESLKSKIYEAYKISVSERSNYTIDHIIPLSIGGSNHEKNLWPEHKSLKKCRQNLEMRLYQAVSAGTLTQAQAVHEIMRVKFLDPCDRL